MEYVSKFGDLRQTMFVWGRADAGYYWLDEYNGPVLLQKSELLPGRLIDTEEERDHTDAHPPYLLPVTETKSYVLSKPLEDEPALFRIFSETEPTKEGILAFANLYGNLTEELLLPESISTAKVKPVISKSQKVSKDFVNVTFKDVVYTDSIFRWQDEIADMANVLEFWDLFKNEDRSKLSEIISWEKDDSYRGGYRLQLYGDKSRRIPIEELETIDIPLAPMPKPGDLLWPALMLVQASINVKCRENAIDLRLIMNEEIKLEYYLMPDNLLAAMWLQFALHVSGETDFRRCEYCGDWTEVSKCRSDWRMHPECRDRKKSKKSYHKKKAEKQAVKKPARKPAKKALAKKKPAKKKATKGKAKK